MSSEKRAVWLEERGAGTKADAFEVHSAVRAVSAIELIFMVLSVVEALPIRWRHWRRFANESCEITVW